MNIRFFLPGPSFRGFGPPLTVLILVLAAAGCQAAAQPAGPIPTQQALPSPTLAITPELPSVTPTPAPSPSPTSAPIPGIDTPITIDGVQLLLVEAGFHETYTLIIQELKPNSPDDQLLVVKTRAISGDPAVSDAWLQQGEVFIVDANGQTYTDAAGASGTIMGEENVMVWAFSVSRQAQGLVLKLPAGNQIPLAQTLSGEAQAAPGAAGVQPTTASEPAPTPVMPVLTDGTSSYRLTLSEMTTQGTAQTATGPQEVLADPGKAFLKLRLEYQSGENLFDLIMGAGDKMDQNFVSDEPGRKYPLVSTTAPIDEPDWIVMLFEQMPVETGAVVLHLLDFPEITLEVPQPGQAGAAGTEIPAQAAPDWPAAVSEPFDANTRDWPEGEFENEYHTSLWKFSAGKYRWEVVARQLFHWLVSPEMSSNSDLYVEVEVQQLSGPENASYGLALRSSDSGFYYFAISDTGYYLFSRVYQGDWVDLIEWTVSPAILPGQVNKLEVIAEGSHFRLFINGQLVDELDDSNNKQGKTGVSIALAKAGDKAIFEFDNFVILAP